MFEDFIKNEKIKFKFTFFNFFSLDLILNLTPAVKITSVSSEISWCLAPHSAIIVNGPNLTCGPLLSGHGLNPNIK